MDDFQSPEQHTAPKKSTVTSVLDKVGKAGNKLVSLMAGLLAAALILYSGYVLYDSFYVQEQAFSSSWDVLQYKPEIITDGKTPLFGQSQLAAINKDYRAWLTMYETSIDYPVLQGENDLFYASHDVYGEVSLTGSIYLAAGNTADFSDSFNLIYGHHMDNGAMFGALDEYLKADYRSSHREGVLVTPEGVWDLYVFAVIETDAYEDAIYNVGPSRTAQQIRDYLDDPSEKTTVHFYDEDAVKGAEKITAMSTCAAAATDGRLVIFCTTSLRSLMQLEVTDYEGVYDAASHGITVSPSYPEGTTIEYSYDGGKTWTEDVPSITDVGVITVMVRASNDNYGSDIQTATLTVRPKPITVRANPGSKTYGTADPDFSAVVDGVIDSQKIVYTVTRPGAGTNENAGSYDDAVVPAGAAQQGNYTITYLPADFTIERAPMEVKAVGYEGVYDGVTHYASAVPSVTEGTVIQYRLTGEGDLAQDEGWTTEPPSILNVGRYTFEVRVLNDNYVTAYDSAALIVDPRPVTVTANDASKRYNAPDPAFTASVSGVVPGESISFTVTRPGAGRDEEAGVYEDAIVPNGAATQGNYIITYYPGDFTVTRADALQLTPTDYTGVYDARPHPAVVTVDVTEGTIVEYSVDGDTWTTEPPAITNVGTVTVYVRATNPDYEPAETTVTLTVTPASVYVYANPNTKVYNTGDPTFTAYVSGVIDGYTIDYSVTRPRAGADEAVGSYSGAIIPAGAQYQGNYVITYVPANFTITPGVLPLSAAGYTGVYDGQEHSPEASTGVAGTTIEYSIDGGVTWTTDLPAIVDVGSVTVLVRATNPNYYTATAEVTLMVTPRPVTVTAVAARKIVGEDDPEFTAIVEGLIDDTEIIYILSRLGGDEDPGVYRGVIVPAGEANQGNYVITYIPADFTILNEDGTVVSSTPQNPGGPDTPDAPDAPDAPGESPTPEEETILENMGEGSVPLARLLPRGTVGGRAWALVNLLCTIATVYLLIPLLHLRDKFGRKKLMQELNDRKAELREAIELKEEELREKLRINRLAALEHARAEEGATEESIELFVHEAEDADFVDITADEFSEAVDELYYKVKEFLRKFRVGVVGEIITAAAAIITFILTEDIRLPMILIDQWTPLMILILLICWVIDLLLIRYREGVLAEEEEELLDQIDEIDEKLEQQSRAD